MTIREMVEQQLKEAGCNGLCHSDMECGCSIEDLFPCENPDWDECKGAVKKPDEEHPGEFLFFVKE